MQHGDARSLAKFKRDLPVELTEAEWIERSKSLSVTHRTLEQMEEDEKLRAKEYKAQRQDVLAAQKRLAAEVETNRKYVPIDVETFAYDHTGEAVTVRLDTGEVLERRGLREDESPELVFDDE